MSEIILISGLPASGKTTVCQPYVNRGFTRLNRDTEGGKVKDLLQKLEAEIIKKNNVVLDNTFATTEIRKPFIELAKKHKATINCQHLTTSAEDAQFNAVLRMVRKYGKLLSSEEIKKVKSPNIFPIHVIFKFKKELQIPDQSEGFDNIEYIPFNRIWGEEYSNSAAFLDFDGTLRETVKGNLKFPCSIDEMEVKKETVNKLKQLQSEGYRLLGVSNQSGIAKGDLTEDKARECFDFTVKKIGVDIEYKFCPHQSFPISCYCRKPHVGFGVYFIEKYKLRPDKCLMVGDMKTDETFAKRCGFKFYWQDFLVRG